MSLSHSLRDLLPIKDLLKGLFVTFFKTTRSSFLLQSQRYMRKTKSQSLWPRVLVWITYPNKLKWNTIGSGNILKRNLRLITSSRRIRKRISSIKEFKGKPFLGFIIFCVDDETILFVRKVIIHCNTWK